ncbi:MAG: bifunctional homocysteine S-methyltransferase/methylenetetrahydrofolate reductase [Myxococcota bacterium]
MAKLPFLDAVQRGGIVGDGAMGSLLYERGVYANRNFEEVNLQQPELVRKIHGDYDRAGADFHAANTFGANRIRLRRYGLEDKTAQIIRTAVQNAKESVDEHAYIGGSLGPTGLSASELRRRDKEARAAFAEHAYLLAEGGCDAILIETFSEIAELRTAIEAVRAAVQLPIVAHVVIGVDGKISDGTKPRDLALEMSEWGADVVGANCNGPDLIFDAVNEMVQTGLPVSAYPNAGRPRSVDERLIYLATPENFGVYSRRMFKAGVKIVGGCCGTNPEHMERVAAAARMVVPREVRGPAIEIREDCRQAATPLEERSDFGSKLGRRFVTSVEVNPKPGLDVSPSIEAARLLAEAGADVINIADGPRASVRMSNVALAVKMQEQLGIETIVHVCTRDKNLLALQANALGAHVLGVRNLVVITGDPPKIGDYPNATAVYDVDSIGLLNMLSGLNCGVDPAGKELEDPTRFVLATGCEPAAADFDREMSRLRAKVAAGAELIMTQPVYDPDHLERFFEHTADLDVPVMVGILPLASYKNAAFLDKNVPGMGIPPEILERMRAAGGGEEGRREGVTIASEVLHSLRHRVAGAYFMPPLGRYEMAAEIIRSLGDDRTLGKEVRGRRDDALAEAG